MARVITLILVFLVILGGVFFLFTNKNTEPKLESTTNVSTESQPNNEQEIASNTKYFLYSPTRFDELKNTKRILFFYANWCPTCRPADENFRANESKIPDGISLIRVNYNDPDTDSDEKELARKYGITYQHTYVLIDSEGLEIKKWNGGQIEELLSNVQ